MSTNDTNKKIGQPTPILPELSYAITGILYETHNMLGRYAREKQYGDIIEKGIPFKREYRISNTGNVADFLIEEKIILEIKAKRIANKEDFYQIQRYLQTTQKQLGVLVNFRDKYLKPRRIVRIDTPRGRQFLH